MSRVKHISLLVLLCAVLTSIVGCSTSEGWDIDTQEAEIANLVVESVAPSGVILGEPVLDRQTRVVTIPMIKGLAQFPLTLSVHITLRINTKEAIPGSTFTTFDNIPFNLPENGGPMLHKFYAVANDDSQREYTILLDIKEGADIETLSINANYQPTDAEVVVERGHIDSKRDRINIVALNPTYPLTINVTPTLSTGATIKSAPPESVDYTGREIALVFASAQTPLSYIVESDRGVVKEWSIRLLEGVENNSSIEKELRAVMYDTRVMSSSITNIAGASIPYAKTNTTSSTLTLYIDSNGVGVEGGVDVVIEGGLRATSLAIGEPSAQTELSFTEYDVPQQVVVVDLLTGQYREWGIEISNAFELTDVLGFEFSYTDPNTPTYIEFEKEAIIDHTEATITLQATISSVNPDYWPVVVTPTIELSIGATSDIGEMGFANAGDIKQFTVTSQTGKTREWSVSIKRMSK